MNRPLNNNGNDVYPIDFDELKQMYIMLEGNKNLPENSFLKIINYAKSYIDKYKLPNISIQENATHIYKSIKKLLKKLNDPEEYINEKYITFIYNKVIQENTLDYFYIIIIYIELTKLNTDITSINFYNSTNNTIPFNNEIKQGLEQKIKK